MQWAPPPVCPVTYTVCWDRHRMGQSRPLEQTFLPPHWFRVEQQRWYEYFRISQFLFFKFKKWKELEHKWKEKSSVCACAFMVFVKLRKLWPPVQNWSTDICWKKEEKKKETFSTHKELNSAGHIFHKCNGWLKALSPLESLNTQGWMRNEKSRLYGINLCG